MNIYGVITGDIVASTRVDPGRRDKLIQAVRDTVDEVNGLVAVPGDRITCEIYRGDSFQILVPPAWNTLRVGLLVRLGLRKRWEGFSSAGKRMEPTGYPFFAGHDARISVGVGSVDYVNDAVSLSDGEAFRNSGRAFDALKGSTRIAVSTPWKTIDDEMRVESTMADLIMRRMTAKQAEVAYRYLNDGLTQKYLAATMEMSPQMVNKMLSYGGSALAEWVDRFKLSVKVQSNAL